MDLHDADGAGGPDRDLKEIVDSMLNPPPRACLARFPTSRPMMQVNPKLADVDNLDVCDAVRDDRFVRVGRKCDESELIPRLLGTCRWRQLKGGVTMDSGFSIDTMPTGHAPGIKMGPVPTRRANRRINAANGTRIR